MQSDLQYLQERGSQFSPSLKSSSPTTAPSISLSPSLFEQINDSNSRGMVFTVYELPTLFRVGKSATSNNTPAVTQVGTPIIAAHVGLETELEFDELQDPVTVILQLEIQEMVGESILPCINMYTI